LIGCDSVIHMAALALVNESVDQPGLYAENNILGTISLLEAMRKAGVKRIIFSSSCVVYGFPKNLPVKEDEDILAFNPYGATKVACENFLATYHFVHQFDVTLLRYFNPYGPNERHEPETHAIPNFILAALDDREIPLYWKGEQTRDFIYVEDLAQAHIDVLKLSGWNVFNVGTENGTKVREVIDLIGEILDKRLTINDLGERKGDVEAVYASSQKLKDATGWSAKYSLKEGLEKTVKWFKYQKHQ
jgi:nucleoside-diphosphate-sugar epimerase